MDTRRTVVTAVVFSTLCSAALACSARSPVHPVRPKPSTGPARERTAPLAGKDPAAEELLRQAREDATLKRQVQARVAATYHAGAVRSFKARQFERAEWELQQALDADKGHAGARTLLATVQRVLGRGPRSFVEQIKQDKLLGRRISLAVLFDTLQRAKHAISAEDYDTALDRLSAAHSAAKALSRWFDLRGQIAAIERLTKQAREAKKRAAGDAARRQRDGARALVTEEHDRIAALRGQRVKRLFDDARQLFDDGRYLLAARKADEILRLDPRNADAARFREQCHRRQADAELVAYHKAKAEEIRSTWQAIRDSSVPFTGAQPIYPPDWDEKLEATRDIAFDGAAAREPDWMKRLREKLETNTTVDFVATSLDDVVAFLRHYKDVNIVIDPEAVRDRAQLDISLSLKNVRFKEALDWILRTVNLKYGLEDGVIYISTAERLNARQQVVTRIYGVDDLTIELRHFKPDIRAISNEMIEEGNDIWNEEDDDDLKPKPFTGESLVEFIKTVIAPGSWQEIAVDKDLF